MEILETRTFEIDKNQKRDCRLPEDKIDKKIKIQIQKTQEEDDDDYSFAMVHHDTADAYITCISGLVSMVSVSDDARQCGIGTILTQLCLNEQKIHNVANNLENRALMKIKGFAKSHDPAMVNQVDNWVNTKCEKIVYLNMVARPPSAAKVYFKSALETGFTEMFIALKSRFIPKKAIAQ